MSIITPSLPLSQASLSKESVHTPVLAPKDLPIKITPPTLTAPKTLAPSPLQELNFALSRLKQALDVKCTSKQEEDSREKLIAKCIKEVKEKIPKGELDISQETRYDAFNFLNLYYDLDERISIKPEYHEISTVLSEAHEKVMHPKFDSAIVRRDKSDRLDFGTCFGQTASFLAQSELSDDEESQRIGRFFQIAYKMNRRFEGNRDPREIGKYLLDHPDECLFIIHKAAHILNYPKGEEMNLIDHAKHDRAPLPRAAIEGLLGKMLLAADKKIDSKIDDAIDQKNHNLTRKKKIKRKLLRLKGTNWQKAKNLKKERQKLSQETHELRQAIKSYGIQQECLDKVKCKAKKRKLDLDNIPEKVLTQHKIRKDRVIVKKTSLKKLPEKLNNLSDKKGQFELHLFSNEKDETDHSVFLSLDPPIFIDINDTIYGTTKKKIRTFNTLEELLAFLPDYFEYQYQELDFDFEAAELTRYEKISSQIPASSSKVAKAADKIKPKT